MKKFTETLIEMLIDHPDLMRVDVEELDGRIQILLTVERSDLGKVIGKKGRNAIAIRTLLTAVAARQNKRVKFEVVERPDTPS
jgi:predicted RNA-binding protein YlqC (UPF0109 family)